jgi:hypothetical protein
VTSVLFRHGALYFMETSGYLIPNRVQTEIQKELVLALESARMRLSIAIAMESKSTPRDRWRYYLDTADQMSRFVKKLRNADLGSRPLSHGWIRALDILKHLPIQNKAPGLCQILRDIVMKLE